MSNTSVRSYGTDYIDHVGVTENTPFDAAAAMEDLLSAWKENSKKTLLTPVHRATTREQLMASCPLVHKVDGALACYSASVMEEFVEARKWAEINYKLRERKFLAFGAYGMEDDETALFKECGEGVEGYEDSNLALNYALEKVKSRKAWKAEQNRHRQPANYGVTEGMTFELPPIDPPKYKVLAVWKGVPCDMRLSFKHRNRILARGWEIKGIHTPKTHAPAIYQLKPKGEDPVILDRLSSSGPEGMRRLAEKLGFTPQGGDTETLNMMMETSKVEWTNSHGKVKTAWPWLASYSSEIIEGQWVVTVSRKRNPVCTPSSYWKDELGELTRNNPNRYTDKETGKTCFLEPGHEDYTAPLTLSELDYHLISESSDLAVEDETGEVVSYMNEEEEFLTSFPQRETDETFVDYKKFCEEDSERALFNECSRFMERSETGITMGELQSQQFINHINHSIDEAQARLDESLPLVVNQEDVTDEDREDMKTVKKFKRLDNLWNHFIGNSKTDHLVQYWFPNNVNRMLCMSSENHAKMIPEVIPGASVMPDNLIAIPVSGTLSRTRYVNRKTISCTLNDAKQLRRQKLVCRAIDSNRFGMLVREKAAALAFETEMTAMTAALRA